MRDVKETVDFYVENLGFNLVMAVPESQDGVHEKMEQEKDYVYAMVMRDDVQMMFQRRDSFKEDIPFVNQKDPLATVSFYMEVEGLEEFHGLLDGKRVDKTEIRTTWYGMKEFYVEDINGYVLGFAQSVQ